MDRLFHGGDYNPDQWLDNPEILADDIAFMQQAKTNTFSVGIFAWSALEPSEGEFHFGWLDKVMDDIAGFGGGVILATPSAARPAWLAEKYPEALRTNARREKMLFGGRHNHCFSSPVYREKTALINRKLAERYKDHKALIMWHVSNELSGECHCDLCRMSFQKWLEKKYNSISALNKAYWSAFWSHSFTCFSQVDPPSPIGEEFLHGLNLDWKRFVTDQTIDFYRNEIAPLREVTPDITITTNFMGEISPSHPHPHPFAGLDYAKFANEVDIVTWDAYPPWHNDYETTAHLASKLAFLNDYYRSLKGKPFLVLESTPSLVNWHPVNKAKRPGMHLLSSVACVAHGADGIMYFQWRQSRGSSEKLHGAVVGHDNSTENRVFKDVAALGAVLENIKEVKGSQTPAKVAILFDMENMWALDDAQGFTRENKKYAETVHVHYKSFWERNIPVDVITKDKDMSTYELVILPMLYMTSLTQMSALASYVKGGGNLVSTYMLATADDNDLAHPGFPAALQDLFGINVLETDTLYPTDRNSVIMKSGDSYEAFDYCAVTELRGAEELGVYGCDFYNGRPVVTMNEFGKGRAYFIGARTGRDFLDDFYGGIYRCEMPIAADAGVSVQVRESDQCRYYFVMNFTEEQKEVSLEVAMRDIVSGSELEAGKYFLEAYGVFVLRVNYNLPKILSHTQAVRAADANVLGQASRPLSSSIID